VSSDLRLFFEPLAHAPANVQLFCFFLIWLGVWLPLAIPLVLVLKWNPLHDAIRPAQKIPLVVSLYAVAPFVVWGAAIVQGVPIAEYGIDGQLSALRSLLGGTAAGVLGILVMVFGQQRLGLIKLQRSTGMQTAPATETNPQSPHLAVIAPIAALAFWVSGIEEMVFRGFLPTQLQRDHSVWWAAAIASLLFALLHLVWDGRKALPQLPGLWIMGMVLSLACWVDGLGLAIGLHAGWIWALSSLDSLNLVHYTGRRATWLTGIDRQPLAGAIGVTLLLLTGLALWAVAPFYR
jgi:uncharacterized protein